MEDSENFKLKYMKYKNKYTNLKNKMSQHKSDCKPNMSLTDILTNNFDKNEFNTKIMFEKKIVNAIKLSLTDFFSCVTQNEFKIKISDVGIFIKSNEFQTIWNWEELKKKFPSKMSLFSEFRNKLVDQLVQTIFDFFPDCITINNKQKYQECVSHASGSSGEQANDFSDYDLTITGCSGVSEIIQIFNSVIIEVFKSTPFEAFDTNLYGYSFLIPVNSKTTRNNKILWTTMRINNTKIYRELKSSNLQISRQDMWAYLRLLSLCNQNPLIILQNEKHNQFFETENNNLNEISVSKKAKLYLDHMKQFELLMEENIDTNIMTNSESLNNVIIENLIDVLSNMNYYGDETYFTQGAFVHVVGLMFYYNDLDLLEMTRLVTFQQLIHSMIENLAYFVKSKNCMIVSIKYFQRFLNAYNLLCIKTNGELKCGNWTELNNTMTFIKLNLRNASNDKIIELVKISQTPTLSIDEFVSQYKSELYHKFNEYIQNIETIVINTTTTNNTKHYYLFQMLKLLKYSIDNLQIYTDITIDFRNGIFIIN